MLKVEEKIIFINANEILIYGGYVVDNNIQNECVDYFRTRFIKAISFIINQNVAFAIQYEILFIFWTNQIKKC